MLKEVALEIMEAAFRDDSGTLVRLGLPGLSVVKQGIEQGLVADKIQRLQSMLGVRESQINDLIGMSKEELASTLEELSLRMMVRFQGSGEG